MALIPNSTILAPAQRETNITIPVFGSIMSLIADQTNHLAFAKAKRQQIAFVNRSYPNTWTDNKLDFDTTAYNVDEISIDTNTRTYTQIFQTSSNCKYLGFILAYRTHENGDRSIEIEAFRDTRTTPVIVDNGCLLSVANGAIASTYDPDGSSNYWGQGKVTSGFDTSSTSILQTEYSRPLFIPLAYRGQEIGVKFTCIATRLDHIGIYELFEEIVND